MASRRRRWTAPSSPLPALARPGGAAEDSSVVRPHWAGPQQARRLCRLACFRRQVRTAPAAPAPRPPSQRTPTRGRACAHAASHVAGEGHRARVKADGPGRSKAVLQGAPGVHIRRAMTGTASCGTRGCGPLLSLGTERPLNRDAGVTHVEAALQSTPAAPRYVRKLRQARPGGDPVLGTSGGRVPSVFLSRHPHPASHGAPLALSHRLSGTRVLYPKVGQSWQPRPEEILLSSREVGGCHVQVYFSS